MSFPENTKDSYKSREIMREFTGSSRIISPLVVTPRKIMDSPLVNDVDCSAMHLHYLTAPTTAGTRTINLANMSEGQSITMSVASSGTAYALAWTVDGVALAVKWPPTGVPVPTTLASKYDIYTFFRVGGMVFGSALLQMG